jgi:pyruvate-formate lyase-activating enzyme
VKLPDLSEVDEVVFSLKAVTPELYLDYTRVPQNGLLENFRAIYEIPHVFLRAESVFIPGYIGFEETEHIARFISSIDKDIPYRIDAYFESGDNNWRRPNPEEIAKVVETAKKHLTKVTSTQQTKRKITKEDLMFEVVRIY